MLMGIVLVLVGVLLAFSGRRMLWLVVGVIGFLFGYSLASRFFPDSGALVQIVLGILLGLVFAFLARFFAKLLLAIAGFLLVGGLALNLAGYFGIHGGLLGVIIFVVGGLIGIWLVSFAFEISIVILSVLAGAALIAQGLPMILPAITSGLALVIALVVGVLGFIAQFSRR